ALTLRAAEEAGLREILLLEEPQAAFYDWTRVHRGQLEPELADIHLVLVVDVGGGTTDLTLIRTEVRDEAPPLLERIAVGDHLLLDGFFPRVAPTDVPARAARAAGLAELGLAYAADPAITRHAAAFLQRHARTAGELRVDAVLFNGGALTPPLLAGRLTEVLSSWSSRPVRRLRNDAPDLAVARGAATY